MGSCFSHGGPPHQRSWSLSSCAVTPLDAQSAGFWRVGTCLQAEGGRFLAAEAFLLATNTLYLLGQPLSHAVQLCCQTKQIENVWECLT